MAFHNFLQHFTSTYYNNLMSKLFYNRMKNIKVSLKRIAEDQIQKAGEGEWELDLDLNEDEIDEFTISPEKA